ncbi:MAG: NADH-quinone oxidoreductase subunit A [Dehalococcoidales bacterium]
MLASYGLIGLFFVVAILFSLTMVVIPIILKYLKIVPSNPNSVKSSIFECGMETIGKTWVQFNFRYYFYALVFLALDVLVVFLYPWAVQLRQLGAFSLYVVLILVFIVLVGYIYAWKKKALEWK